MYLTAGKPARRSSEAAGLVALAHALDQVSKAISFFGAERHPAALIFGFGRIFSGSGLVDRAYWFWVVVGIQLHSGGTIARHHAARIDNLSNVYFRAWQGYSSSESLALANFAEGLSGASLRNNLYSAAASCFRPS